MSGKVIVLDKSFDFAVRVVNLYKYLCNDKKEFTLSKQLLRSGTSIGANKAGQSKADFISKMSIASKEARETKYWTELLIKTDYLNIKEDYVKSLLNEIDELIKIITSIVKTSKENSR